MLLHRAIGDQLTCIFVNNGLLRLEEAERVQDTFKRNLGLNLLYIDATERFVTRLAEVTDPEQKRKVIGEEFIRVFEEASAGLGQTDFLAQGTLYPDVIESETPENRVSARIKTHHNVGGLPEQMKLQLVEPLRYLFKDEVRDVGLELGLPGEIVYRQPFPGPGLAIRIIGEVTPEKLDILRACDWIVIDEIKRRRPLRPTLAKFRRFEQQSHGGSHGGLPYLRLRLCHPRRLQRGRHDRRLGASSLRGAGPHLQSHSQRSAWREPGRVRHYQQAPRHHRVGIA